MEDGVMETNRGHQTNSFLEETLDDVIIATFKGIGSRGIKKRILPPEKCEDYHNN